MENKSALENRAEPSTGFFADKAEKMRLLYRRLAGTKPGKKVLRQGGMLVLGFLLARVTALGGYAPFGISYLASLSGKPGMAAAFAGTLFGYMTAHASVNGVKYIAVCLMVFLVTFILGRVFVTDSCFYSTVIVTLCLGSVALIYALADSSGGQVLLLYIAELMLAVFSALMFRTALTASGEHPPESAKERQTLCVLALLALAGAAMPAFSLGAFSLSPGKAAGMVFLLMASHAAGVYGGVVTGLMVGLAADLAGTGAPVYTAALSLAGLLAGLFAARGKVFMTVAFFLSMATIWVSLPGGMAEPGRLLDALFAGVIFAFVPATSSKRLADLFVTGEKTRKSHGKRVKSFVSAKLSGLAAAYEELADTISCQEEATAQVNGADLFRAACQQLCVSCPGKTTCWQTEETSLRKALSESASRILARGSAQAEDFPARFTANCPHMEQFVELVNQDLFKARSKQRFQSEINEGRRLLCRQYGQLAEALDNSAEDVAKGMQFDGYLEQQVKSFLYDAGIPCEVLAYRDQGGVLHVELCGENLGALCGEVEALTEIISQIADCPFGLPEQLIGREIQCFSFAETAAFTCQIGAAAEKRPGNGISGDCGTYFIGKNNCTYIVLCDGMGSGEAAREEAKKAVRLLESFLKAGIAPEQAAEIITSALLLDSESRKFSTMDIAEINVRTGQLTLVKCGAAPAFLRRKRREGGFYVSELWGETEDKTLEEAPSEGGIAVLLRPKVTRKLLNEGDMLFLVSDGVCASDNPEFRMGSYIAKLNGEKPREMAEMVLRMTRGEGSKDDKTVIAVLFQREKTE